MAVEISKNLIPNFTVEVYHIRLLLSLFATTAELKVAKGNCLLYIGARPIYPYPSPANRRSSTRTYRHAYNNRHSCTSAVYGH